MNSAEKESEFNSIFPVNQSALINRIKERLEALEIVNDNLFYSICYLIENLPDLISKTIQADLELYKKVDFIKKALEEEKEDALLPENKYCAPRPTRREYEVLSLLEKGYCAKEIANRLFISETTVITHKKNLKKKFNVKNTVELISILKSNK